MYWINYLRKEYPKQNFWLLTADKKLPLTVPQNPADSKPLVVTVDALLQWFAPLSSLVEQPDITSAFAELVRQQFLPNQRFLNAEDFRIFAHLDMQCKNLPAEDVEYTIGKLRLEGAGLDVSKAEDREKLSYIVQKAFTDPSRKYATELEKLYAEIDRIQSSKYVAETAKQELELEVKQLSDRVQELENYRLADLAEQQQVIQYRRVERKRMWLNTVYTFGTIFVYVLSLIVLATLRDHLFNIWAGTTEPFQSLLIGNEFAVLMITGFTGAFAFLYRHLRPIFIRRFID